MEEIYQKKTQLEHILLRPDTYIGSVERQCQTMWVFDEAAGCMTQRTLSFVPGLFKIFDEILVNAADNKIRDPAGMDTLKVDIDKENGSISIYNNGRGIPIAMHKEEKVYVPELIFGQLLTSSNYDDKEKKVTGGRNGYGAKLCNIFSREFIVETADKESRQHYKQVFSGNMSKRSDPKISKWTKEDFTRITFKPDFAKFGMEAFEEDTEALFRKRVYDMCACISDVKVFLNGERLKIKNFKQYVELYMKKPSVPGEEGALTASQPAPMIIHEKVNDRWEICAAVSEGQFQQVSFVNSINTYKGGTHVDHVASQIVGALVEAVKKKSKDMASIKPFQVKNHLSIFVNCLVENPTFDSQTKENMTLRQSAFGSKCDIGEDFMKKVMKSGVLENIMNWAKYKQDLALKKTDGAKRSRLSGIAKLDDANNAGTKNGHKCTLILTEGDSAKALAVSGLSVVGRDNYGVFPLRGKLLNVREASAAQIGANAEITALKQILGLQQNKVYESTETLRYGHIMIMTDQDHDGSHIKGLLINFLEHFWPSLLKIPGFLLEFITPIVKATKGRQEVSFYTIPQYEQWKQATENGRGWTIKYYKGLGTSTAADAKKYFQNMDEHRKVFGPVSPEDRQLVDMAFNKKRADERKDWLKTCTPDTFMDHAAGENITISDFINKELILFSQADNVRSIPSMLDGLKPGQRKIMFACFKRKLKAEIKVMQLAGYVSEHAAYHHGEQSLCQTIIGLAQDYVGSNNLNLLEPNGQFGTRLQGGKDAASPRYIFTNLSPFARLLFKPEDDALLKYLNDDGQSIEPSWYIPILPMVLVNGSEGIGTGWSTSIPSYNPGDIARNLLRLMDGQACEEIHPWYSGFRGAIEPLDASNSKYKVSGTWRKVDGTTLEITELPIGTWTQTYKEFLEALITADGAANLGLRDYKEHHTDSTVKFSLHLTEAGMEAAEKEGIEKRFKLLGSLNLSNLVCFDPAGLIKKYTEGPNGIIQDFYDIRLEYYQKRKEHLAGELTKEWTVLDSKVRFIREIVSGSLVVQNRKKADVVADLAARSYHKEISKPNADGDIADATETAEETSGATGGYEYLLRMPIYSLTHEKIKALEAEREAKEVTLNELLAKTPRDLWRADLNAFLDMWDARETQKNSHLDKLLAGQKTIGSGKKTGGGAGKKKAAAVASIGAAKRAITLSDDEDDDVVYGESEESEYEVLPVKKNAAPKPKPSSAESLPTMSTGSSIESVLPKQPAKRAKAAPKPKAAPPTPSSTLDAFVMRKTSRQAVPVTQPVPTTAPISLIDSDEELDLPLAERIQRMLARKAAAAAESSNVPSVQPTPAPRQAAPPPPKPAAKPKAKLIQIESSSESDAAYSEESEEESDDDVLLPTTADAITTSAGRASRPPRTTAAPVKKSAVIISDSDEEDEDVFEPSD